MTPETALIAASGLHLGFQAVVTVVVYPALVATSPRDWETAHADHSRRISRVVAPLYLAVAGACAWTILAGPHHVWSWIAVGGHAVAAATTAVSAAPSHGRLARTGPVQAELTRLLRADRVRLAATLIAFAASLAA